MFWLGGWVGRWQDGGGHGAHRRMQDDDSSLGEEAMMRPGDRSGRFTTTHWSAVMAAAGAGGDGEGTREAREELFGAYWYPLYAFVRRTGRSPEDAEDLVQGFFARVLEKNYLEAVEAGKGRFRTFLLVALKRYMANEWDRERARKRGGGREVVPLEGLGAEERYARESRGALTPDQEYERRWALVLLDRVLVRLREEEGRAGRGGQFEGLREALISRERGTPYADLGHGLGLSEGAVKVAVHRLRQRYRRLLEEEIGRTVGSPEEVEAERRYLLALLSG